MKVWIQKWEEAESGWGSRPDGYTVHRTEADIRRFFDAMRAKEAARGYGPNNVPESYTRLCGKAYEAEITDEQEILKLETCGHGYWGSGGNKYPPSSHAWG